MTLSHEVASLETSLLVRITEQIYCFGIEEIPGTEIVGRTNAPPEYDVICMLLGNSPVLSRKGSRMW